MDAKLMQAAALLDSDPAAAQRVATDILKEYPGHPTATLLLGTALRNSGDPLAADTFNALAAAKPESAVAQLDLGLSLVAQQRSVEAIAALTRAVELEPRLAEAWRALATLHAGRGDTRACDAAYAHFAQLTSSDQALAEAAIAVSNHRLDMAETLLRQRLDTVSIDAAALRMLAVIAAEREDYVEAERLFAECLAVAPGYSRARYDLANTLYSQQKAHPMVPLLERLLEFEPTSLAYRSLLASAYGLLGQGERSLQLLESLIAESPRNESLWLHYGNALRTSGRLADAVAAFRQAAALRSSCGEAWFCLANLKTFRFAPDDIGAMRAQLERTDLNDNDRLQFEFALGKALEDAAQFEESFAHYSRGNALRRAAVVFDGEANTRLVERSKALYTRDFFAQRAGFGCAAPDPIFIVGLPRSGSTLLEQILASHSMVEGTRELPDVPGFALELGIREQRGKPPSYPQSVASLSNAQLTALGERYLAQTRPNRRRGAPFFIDKMPVNFSHVGLIHLMLPNARIIDARRSPLGCCFSNFKQHFQSGVWFTYQLQDLGRFYRNYVSLMRHFDTVLPGRVHRVYYENIVTHLEDEVRRLLAYCGLPFEESCLRFHENKRLVQTASSEQVRTPLYVEGLDQWRHYEPWLGELKAALGDLEQLDA